MKTGDLLAWDKVKINSFFDLVLYLYQKIFKAKFIHVGVVYTYGDRYFVVESTPPVVRIFPISMYLDDFYHIPCNIDITPRQKRLLLYDLGKKYSIWDLIKSVLPLRKTSDEYYCSELAFKFYKDVGLLYREEDGDTPDDLVEAIIAVT